MKISFDKVSHTPKPFALERNGLMIEGMLEKRDQHSIELKAKMIGKIELDCDRCGTTYHQNIDEALTLYLTDEISQDKDDLDIIEFLDGMIDITYILEGEANAIVEEYHFCAKCTNDDNIIEIEF